MQDGAPDGHSEAWKFSGKDLNRLYAWLGGGQGQQAHPHAMQLLIDVARGRGETPITVLQRHLDTFNQRVEEVLLRDLVENVLNDNERTMLDVLALYRSAIPHDHADALERHLSIPGAWDGIDRRCLLASDVDQSRYYLHSFIAGWVRVRMGYVGYGEDGDADVAGFKELRYERPIRRLHNLVATCWLEQLNQSQRATHLNIERALEAFHHLVAAGESSRIQAISVKLLTGNQAWARKRIRFLYEHLHRSNAPLNQLRQALAYAAILDPENSRIHRFLGECWAKEKGWASKEALNCFETACRLQGDFPAYWADLGKALLAQGQAGAADFLSRVQKLRKERPRVIDDYVIAVEADCLTALGRGGEASALRMKKIDSRNASPVFYVNEAQARIRAADYAGALAIVGEAKKNRAYDAYTARVHAQALDLSGNHEDATNLRMTYIRAGKADSALYVDEANARLQAGSPRKALEICNLAKSNKVSNEVIENIQRRALRELGRR